MSARWITPRLLALIGAVVFAVTLAILLSNLLSGDASLIALGMALGIVIGIPLGAGAIWLGFRRGQASVDQPPAITLTPEQSESLLRALERQQTSPAAFGLATRQPRPITPVGGADLSAISGESSEQSSP